MIVNEKIVSIFSNILLSEIGYTGTIYPGLLRALNNESIYFSDIKFSYISLEANNIEHLEKILWFYSHHISDRMDSIAYSLVSKKDMLRMGRTDEIADFEFDYEAHKIAENIKRDIEKLKQSGFYHLILNTISTSITSDQQNSYEVSTSLSKIKIDNDFKIFLPDYNNIEIKLSPLPKALYFLFLRHPEGILLKHIYDYKEELLGIYKELVYFDDWETALESINKLTNPSNNSINEKCSRIKEAFVKHFEEKVAQNYYITGKRGKEKRVILDQELIIFEYENFKLKNSTIPRTIGKTIEESKQIAEQIEAIYKQGMDSLLNKEYWNAITFFDDTIKLNPFHCNSIIMKALCFFHLGNYKESEELNSLAISMNERSDIAYHNRGEARLLLNKHKECEEDFTHYLKYFDNKCKESYFIRGLARMETGNAKAACQDWFNSSELGHDKAKKYLKNHPEFKIKSLILEEKERF